MASKLSRADDGATGNFATDKQLLVNFLFLIPHLPSLRHRLALADRNIKIFIFASASLLGFKRMEKLSQSLQFGDSYLSCGAREFRSG
jgi:hypothetical protein